MIWTVLDEEKRVITDQEEGGTRRKEGRGGRRDEEGWGGRRDEDEGAMRRVKKMKNEKVAGGRIVDLRVLFLIILNKDALNRMVYQGAIWQKPPSTSFILFRSYLYIRGCVGRSARSMVGWYITPLFKRWIIRFPIPALYENHRGIPTFALLNVLGVLGLLNVLNVLRNVLNLLNMPNEYCPWTPH